MRISDRFSVGQVTLGVGLNITAWSYVDRFNICLMANKTVVADGEQFLGRITRAFEEYASLRDIPVNIGEPS